MESDAAAMDVSAVIVSYNSEDRIARAVELLEAALAHLRYEVIVVDNASTDDSVGAAQAAIVHGYVIANADNVGFGQGVNAGLRAARGRYTMILNDDVELNAGCVDALIEALSHDPKIALAGPLLVDANGTVNDSARQWYPGWQEEMLRVKDIVTRSNTRKAYPNGSGAIDVAWLVAACVMGPTRTLREIGGFNDAFFLYGEDIDLGRRIRELGLRSVTVPQAKAVHIGHVSTTAAWASSGSKLRRMRGRDVYYRLWMSRPARMGLNLRRAVGLRNQPERLRFFGPRVFWDGRSLRSHRFPAPLPTDAPSSQNQSQHG